jgi:putative transposase
MTQTKPHKGWYSRGYLPHCDAVGLVQHIVFGLADSIPPGRRSPSVLHADRLLDAGHGSCALREATCAEFVQDAMLHSDGERYRLIAWCIMPNHVHAIIEQAEGFPLGDVVQSWKSAASHKINAHLAREGRLWRREYFDRFMRDDDHLAATIAYVEDNPVRAKLVNVAADWRFSSARLRM